MPRRNRAVLLAATATTATLVVTAPNSAAVDRQVEGQRQSSLTVGHEKPVRERAGFFDVRADTIGAGRSTLTAETARELAATTRSLRRSVPGQLQLRVDPATGTPASLSVLDGFLTGPSNRPAEAVVRGYLRDNAASLGLTGADLSTMRLRKSYTDSAGVTHLAFEQVSRGIPVFGNGVEAHLTRDGELISVQGSPIARLGQLTAGRSTTPDLSAGAARTIAAQDVGGTAEAAAIARAESASEVLWSNGDRADLVWFIGGERATLGWTTYTQAGGDTLTYSHVVGDGGEVLYRNDLVDFADETGEARVYDYYPGATNGGTPRVVDLVERGWIGRRAPWLRGANVSAWADLNDDNALDPREKTPLPGRIGRPQFVLKSFEGEDQNDLCSDEFICTWDPETPNSWRRNKRADVTNAFYLANVFHDWLARPAIGFTVADGNFQRNGGDPVLLHALDGADTADGLPDVNHVNNANMSTPPDGLPPTMQMYLFHQPGQPNSVDPFLPMSSSFDASILFHEYVHGLSNRLVTDASGNSTLNSVQAGAMGEAWSDYYAMDYLVAKGLQRDTSARDGQVRIAKYTLADTLPFRTQAIDCDLDSTSRWCTQIDATTTGGYTYGDFPTIGGAPQVHASGEVWTQTLWDIREVLGSNQAARIITQGMRLSVNDPTMLDMRNAILQADQVINDGANNRLLWRVFANRGMGWFAGAVDAGDAYPAESFKVRPAPERPTGAITGSLTDDQTGEPISGLRVVITGHGDAYAATTSASGEFTIPNVLPGTYLKVTVGGKGYDGITRKVRVRSDRATNLTAQLRRDWAAASGGGEIVDFSGPDYSDFGCGPGNAIDLRQGTGWGSTTGDDNGNPTGTPIPKHVDIELPRAIDITAASAAGETAFRVDPSNTCGDPGSSSTNEYRIEVSTDGENWTQVADGGFGTINDRDTRGRYFDVAATQDAADVTHVRFWMDSPQVPDIATNCAPDGPFGGCTYMDMTEIQVYGTPSTP